MLAASYLLAATAMSGAALYLCFRLRLFVTTTTMLLGSLLLIYGPAYLSFVLSSGEFALPFRLLSGDRTTNAAFALMKEKVRNFDSVIIVLNLSIALMYAGIIAGIEITGRLFSQQSAMLKAAVANWNATSLRADAGGYKILFGFILCLTAFMAFVSISEDQIGTIKSFLSASDRNAYRFQFGGSSNYPYRIILNAIAPAFVIWGAVAGVIYRSWLMLFVTLVLFAAVMLGKSETLSKAPPAIFLIQLMVPLLVLFTNKVNWRIVLGGSLVIALLLYADVQFIANTTEGLRTLEALYSRIFEAESESLIQSFAVFPALHPYMAGTNIRPIAIIMGRDFIPSDKLVASIWTTATDVTTPSLFIADAWAGFSYAGVIVSSLLAGAVCRLIDLIFLAKGKNVVAVVIIGAVFSGIFTLLTTALNTAFTSGGLVLAPVVIGLLTIAIRYFDRPHPAS